MRKRKRKEREREGVQARRMRTRRWWWWRLTVVDGGWRWWCMPRQIFTCQHREARTTIPFHPFAANDMHIQANVWWLDWRVGDEGSRGERWDVANGAKRIIKEADWETKRNREERQWHAIRTENLIFTRASALLSVEREFSADYMVSGKASKEVRNHEDLSCRVHVTFSFAYEGEGWRLLWRTLSCAFTLCSSLFIIRLHIQGNLIRFIKQRQMWLERRK